MIAKVDLLEIFEMFIYKLFYVSQQYAAQNLSRQLPTRSFLGELFSVHLFQLLLQNFYQFSNRKYFTLFQVFNEKFYL